MRTVVIRRERPKLPPQPEADFMSAVIKLARLLGWRVYHSFYSMRSTEGWPDLAMVRSGRLVLAELKAEDGRLTSAQEEWLADLRQCQGVEVYVWKRTDWAEIKRVLGLEQP